MKKLSLILLLVFTTITFTQAQEAVVDEAFKKSSIERLNQLMNDFYVFPDVAKKTEKHLNKLLASGHFDECNDTESFAKVLTKEVQEINKDKHMRIRPRTIGKAPVKSVDRIFEEQLYYKNRGRNFNAGFKSAQKLEGNVGYLDLRGFANVYQGGPVADDYMNLLSTSDAIIIDLRKNGGGDPAMVQHLCTYFFDKKVHLNSLYWRASDETQDFWTLDEIPGKRMPDVPLFILTSNYTFSAAEEFSYNMQTQKRATLVGETTGGGANPGGTRPINEYLSVFIPTGRAINPITKTNWEGVGVVPEVKTTADEAYDKGVELATAAAEQFRESKKQVYQDIFKKITANLEELSNSHSEEKLKKYKKGVYKNLKKATEVGLFDEGDINMLGYSFLMEFSKPVQAEMIFKCNTKLFPESANVHDSYGEALAKNGKLKDAVKSYEKAVAVGEKNKDPQLELYKQNLKAVQDQIKP